MCQFCKDLGLDCDLEFDDDDLDENPESSYWCDCGHLHVNHEYLTMREIDALQGGDIECGHCRFAEDMEVSSYEGEFLTYVWVDFKPGQSQSTIEAILSKLENTPEDPCDNDFMRDISS